MAAGLSLNWTRTRRFFGLNRHAILDCSNLTKHRLRYLYERLGACCGRANVFVRDHARVRVIHAVGVDEAPQAGPADPWNGPATVGALVARLETRPEGIRTPDGTVLPLGGQTVAWDRMPHVGRIDVPSCSHSSLA